MPIVSSTIVEDRAQADGRRAVRERHADNLGRVREVSYLAESGADVAATMAARVASLDAQQAASEVAANLAEILGDDL